MHKIIIPAKHEIIFQTFATHQIKMQVLSSVRVPVWIKINNFMPQIRKEALKNVERNQNGNV